MNPILHKTLALTLSASLLATYGTPAFAAHEVITEEKTISDVNYENYTEGAILNESNLTIRNVNFSSNSTGQLDLGGAIENKDYNAQLNIQDSSFTNNTANAGGALFLRGNTTISDTEFTDNKALNSEAGAGAIYLALHKKGNPLNTLTMNNVSFTNNQALASTAEGGGAVGLFSKADLNDVTFTNNKVEGGTGGGGAMFLGAESLVTLTKNTFKDNTSSSNGGALATREHNLANNQYAKLDILASSFTGNKATEKGGAFYNTFYNSNTKEGAVFISDTSFANNGAEKGGAIYNNGETDQGGKRASLTIANSTFEGNSATKHGGAIFNATKAVLNLEGNNTFADNTANGVANDIYNDGTLNINSGTTTLAGGITGNGALNVKSSSVLNLGQSTAEADSISFDNGSTLAVEFANDTMGNLKANTITIGENANDSAKLLVTLSRDFLTDTTGISHELTNGTDVKNGSFAMADASNALYNVTFDNNIVTAVRKTQEETNQEIANAGGNTNDMNVINAFTNSSDMGSAAANQTADVINNLAQTDVAAAVSATKAVAPEAASAKQVVHGSIAREVFNSLQTRMDTAVNAAPQAFALDDEQKVQNQGSYSVWMQGLLNKSHKEATDTSAFTGNSTGLAFGADTNLADDILLGAGYAYTHTNVSSDGRHDRILGDNFFVYGQYRPSRFYVQASLGYGDSKYEEAKYLPGLNINADYHIKSYSAQATAGYELTDMFTPTLGLRYINLQQEGYKDSADQSVSAEQNSYLSGVVGVTIKNEVYSSSVLHLLPQLHAGLSYDFVSDNAQGNVFLPNGSNYSISGERLHRLGFEAGASVSAYLSDNWEALLGYEGNFRQDYNSHTGTLKVRYLF
ncbi:autotransporter outer membrane beta-barrel domain-containing protein [Candidatus Avelusimicrobium fimicolum]|uniref:autotransporter outer membrane beta-barrel domain-containing protein n=1 Tax=Candidatus Avelusimicrobium fimicolum TaxID=3416216 RepID=UPI003D113931